MKKKEPGYEIRAKLRIIRILENFIVDCRPAEAIFPARNHYKPSVFHKDWKPSNPKGC